MNNSKWPLDSNRAFPRGSELRKVYALLAPSAQGGRQEVAGWCISIPAVLSPRGVNRVGGILIVESKDTGWISGPSKGAALPHLSAAWLLQSTDTWASPLRIHLICQGGACSLIDFKSPHVMLVCS